MWLPQAQKGRDILALSIPRQYLLPPSKLPPASLQNVANFPAHSGLSPKELHITSLSAVQLVREMDGRLSAEEVVTAFIKRAVIGHQLVPTCQP